MARSTYGGLETYVLTEDGTPVVARDDNGAPIDSLCGTAWRSYEGWLDYINSGETDTSGQLIDLIDKNGEPVGTRVIPEARGQIQFQADDGFNSDVWVKLPQLDQPLTLSPNDLTDRVVALESVAALNLPQMFVQPTAPSSGMESGALWFQTTF